MKKFTLHLFDLDDTLINTSSSYLAAYKAVLELVSKEHTAVATISLEILATFCRLVGSSKPELVFTNIYKFYNWQFTWQPKQLANIFWREFWARLQIFPYAKEYLRLLTIAQKKIAIVSNGDVAKQQKKLTTVALQKQFSTKNCFVSANFAKEFAKPSPLMIEEAIKQNQVCKEQTIFYGNLDSDILAGKLAKVTTASLLIKPPILKNLVLNADYHFTSWQQVIKQLL